jgi:hypothetical protein
MSKVNGGCDKPFVQIYRDEFFSVLETLTHPAVHLLVHLILGADYRTDVYDARSIYELGEDWGKADGVTRRAFNRLEQAGLVKQLPDKGGIHVQVRQLIIPPRRGADPHLSGVNGTPQRRKSTPQRSVPPAKTTPYITCETSHEETEVDMAANARAIAQIRSKFRNGNA